jgi:hypothetical protein
VAEIVTNRFYWGDLPLFQEIRGDDGVTSKVQVG